MLDMKALMPEQTSIQNAERLTVCCADSDKKSAIKNEEVKSI